MIDDAVFAGLDYLLGKDISEAGALVRQGLGDAYFTKSKQRPDEYPALVGDAPATVEQLRDDAAMKLAAAQAAFDAAQANLGDAAKAVDDQPADDVEEPAAAKKPAAAKA